VKTRFPHLVAAVAALLLAGSMDSQACAACFGKSDSAMAQGMNMGILSLVAVIGLVLAGLVSFFVYIAKRTAAYEARQALEDASEESLTDND
jgi:hypothetical protein